MNCRVNLFSAVFFFWMSNLFSAAEENEMLYIRKVSLLYTVRLSFASVFKGFSAYEMYCLFTAMSHVNLFHTTCSILDFKLRQAFGL